MKSQGYKAVIRQDDGSHERLKISDLLGRLLLLVS